MHWHRMYLLVCVGREGGQGTHLPHTGAFCIDNSVNDISTNFFYKVIVVDKKINKKIISSYFFFVSNKNMPF